MFSWFVSAVNEVTDCLFTELSGSVFLYLTLHPGLCVCFFLSVPHSLLTTFCNLVYFSCSVLFLKVVYVIKVLVILPSLSLTKMSIFLSCWDKLYLCPKYFLTILKVFPLFTFLFNLQFTEVIGPESRPLSFLLFSALPFSKLVSSWMSHFTALFFLVGHNQPSASLSMHNFS